MSEPTLLILGPRRGRRPRAESPSTKRVEFRLTEQEQRDLERVAVSEKKSVSEIVRDAVNGFVGDFSEAKPFVYGRNSKAT